MDDQLTEKTADIFDPAFRRKAASALSEFESALGAVGGVGTKGERARLRDAAEALMRIVARALIQTE